MSVGKSINQIVQEHEAAAIAAGWKAPVNIPQAEVEPEVTGFWQATWKKIPGNQINQTTIEAPTYDEAEEKAERYFGKPDHRDTFIHIKPILKP